MRTLLLLLVLLSTAAQGQFIKTRFNSTGIKVVYNTTGLRVGINPDVDIPVDPPPSGERVSGNFPMTKHYMYHTGASNWDSLSYFIDNQTTDKSISGLLGTNWVLDDSSEFVFLFGPRHNMRLKNIRFFDGNGSSTDAPVKFWAILPESQGFQKVLLGTHDFTPFNQWVNLTLPDSLNIYAIEMQVFRGAGTVRMPTEIQFQGSWTPYTRQPLQRHKPKLNDLAGQNLYWNNYQSPSTVSTKRLDSARTAVTQSVAPTVRLYTDGELLWLYDPRLNNGNFFTPEFTHLGGGACFDTILHHLHNSGTNFMVALKDVPPYIRNTFPTSDRKDYIPVRYDAARWPAMLLDPTSYIEIAGVHRQMAIRWGSNPNVPLSQLRLYPESNTPWNPSLSIQTPKVGLGYLKIIEAENEKAKNWAVPKRTSYMTGRESLIFYSVIKDGHKNTLGDTVGIAQIDPTIQLAAGGQPGANPGYLLAHWDMALRTRGRLPNGDIDMPIDIYKFHQYYSDAGAEQFNSPRTRGAAPETNPIDSIIGNLQRAAYPDFLGHSKQLPLMVGETGYDKGNTVQQARQMLWAGIGRAMTMADWKIRTMLAYARLGIHSNQFYQGQDDGGGPWFNKTTGDYDSVSFHNPYLQSGDFQRREDDQPIQLHPSGKALAQVVTFLGEYAYDTTLLQPHRYGFTDSSDVNYNGDTVFLDRYVKGDSIMHILHVGTEHTVNVGGVWQHHSMPYQFHSDSSHLEISTYDYFSLTPIRDTIPVVGGVATVVAQHRAKWIRQFNMPVEENGLVKVELVFDGAPTINSVTPAVLPYDKDAALFQSFDDNPLSAIIDGADRFDTLKYSKGIPGDSANWAAQIGVNIRRVFNFNEIGAVEPLTRVQYGQMVYLYQAGWDIANHGYLHDPNGNFGYSTVVPGDSNRQRVLNNIKLLNDTLPLKIGGYRPRSLIGASNYAWWGDAGQRLGMLSVTGQADSVFFPNWPVPRVNKPGTYPPSPGYFENIGEYGAIYREFTDGWLSSLTSLKTKVDDLLTGNSATVHKFLAIGTHGVSEAQRDYYAQFVTYVRDQAADRLYVGTLREAMEHRANGQLPRTWTVQGNKLTITIDKALIHPETQYGNLTLLIGTSSNIASASVNGQPISFNNTKKLINIDLGVSPWEMPGGGDPDPDPGGGDPDPDPGSATMSGYGPGIDTGTGVAITVRPPLNKYTVNVSGRVKGFMEWLPNDYHNKPGKRYPLLIMMHGQGEIGDGSSTALDKMRFNPPFKFIYDGATPTYFMNGADTMKFIWIAPQFTNVGGDSLDVHNILNYMYSHYRVDTSRVYLTGLSYGGGLCWEYTRHRTDWSKRIAAMAPVASSRGKNAATQAAGDTMAKADIKIWTYHHTSDPQTSIFNPRGFVNFYNSSAFPKTQNALITEIAASTHAGWYEAYNHTYAPAILGNLNVYRWLLHYSKPAP